MLKEINRGTFGKIYEVDDFTVVKVLENSLTTKEGLHELVIHKYITDIVDSNYVAKLLKFEVLEDNIHLYMNKAKCNIWDYIKNNNLSIIEKKDTMFKVCRCIKELHDNEIIHHDIKPGNLLMYNNNDIKICDFGTSMVKKYNHHRISGCTIMYASYEELFSAKTFNELKVNFKTDIWALAITLIEIYTTNSEGYYYPFSTEDNEVINNIPIDDYEILIKNIDRYEDNIRLNNKYIDDPILLDLLDNMLNLDISKRFDINQVLNHPYFNNYSITHCFNLNIYDKTIKHIDKNVIKFFKIFHLNINGKTRYNLIKLIKYLYNEYNDIIEEGKYLNFTFLYIAAGLTYNDNLDERIDKLSETHNIDRNILNTNIIMALQTIKFVRFI